VGFLWAWVFIYITTDCGTWTRVATQLGSLETNSSQALTFRPNIPRILCLRRLHRSAIKVEMLCSIICSGWVELVEFTVTATVLAALAVLLDTTTRGVQSLEISHQPCRYVSLWRAYTKWMLYMLWRVYRVYCCDHGKIYRLQKIQEFDFRKKNVRATHKMKTNIVNIRGTCPSPTVKCG